LPENLKKTEITSCLAGFSINLALKKCAERHFWTSNYMPDGLGPGENEKMACFYGAARIEIPVIGGISGIYPDDVPCRSISQKRV